MNNDMGQRQRPSQNDPYADRFHNKVEEEDEYLWNKIYVGTYYEFRREKVSSSSMIVTYHEETTV